MSDTPTQYGFPVIGTLHSCFKEKFGIPRQPGLAPEATAVLELLPPYNDPAAVDGLEQCSHIWLQFVFHQNLKHSWRAKVRPPRLGGNKMLGVFATRSPVRPSALGLSVVRLDKIETNQGVQLHISGGDMLDGTPVVDIKPYVPYVDAVPNASNAIANTAPSLLAVSFNDEVEKVLANTSHSAHLKRLIEQLLQQDPRPRYQQTDTERTYGMKLYDYDLRWRYIEREQSDSIEVVELKLIAEHKEPF